ncbi:zinc transporter ZupT, partial [bacterium]|nr:zinc transporter ZupT [bacterium]
MAQSQVFIAFGLTLIAGLSTGIGSAIAFFAKRTNTKFLAVSLGFSAGVMIYVSFVEILAKGSATLSASMGDKKGAIFAAIAFFAGMLLIAIIDKLIPEKNNPHEIKYIEGSGAKPVAGKKLMRSGLLTAVAIAIHNFPEGLATFVVALKDVSVAI